MEKLKYTLIQRNKSRGIMTWYARIKKPGKSPKFVSLGTTRKGEATALLAEKIAAGEFEERTGVNITFGVAVEKFLRKCEQNGVKEGSMGTYVSALVCFDKIRNMEVCSTPADTVYEVFNQVTRDYSTATFNLHRVVCSSLYNYLIDELDLSVKNPFRKLRTKRNVPVTRKSFWTMEQIEKILAEARTPKHRLFYAIMAYAGLRHFEAKKLRAEDIRDGRIYVVGKGDKVAFVPICELLQLEMDAYHGDYNFKSAGDISTFKRAVEKAGVLDDASCGFHRLRHSFGSNLIRAGANVKAVQLLMRHSSIQTTLNVYAHLLDSDLVTSVNLLGRK